MSQTQASYEIKCRSDLVTVILHPPLADKPWNEVNAVGDEAIEKIEHRTRPAVVIDLTPLSYLGSSGIALLVRIWKGVNSRSGKMAVICTHPVVLDVLKIASLDKVWQIVGNSASAESVVSVQVDRTESEIERGFSRQSRRKLWKVLAWAAAGLLGLTAVAGALYYRNGI